MKKIFPKKWVIPFNIVEVKMYYNTIYYFCLNGLIYYRYDFNCGYIDCRYSTMNDELKKIIKEDLAEAKYIIYKHYNKSLNERV